MPQIPLYQVDAFTDRVFGGNPAAVCPLPEFLPDATLQAIGNENNLSETAFLVPNGAERFHLRWFTPESEIDLCGHATLASAFVVFTHLRPDLQQVAFDTKSGELVVKRAEARLLSMDFPARPPEPGASDSRLRQALGGKAGAILVSRDYLVVYESEEEVRALKPDMPASSVARFGEAAGQQLERLTALLDAVLGLARADGPQTDVATTLRRVVAVCGASSSSRDAAIRLEEVGEIGSAITVVPGVAVRLALTAILLELAVGLEPAARMPEISCRLNSTADGSEVVITTTGRRASMPESIAEVVRIAGVRWTEGEGRISLIFPRA